MKRRPQMKLFRTAWAVLLALVPACGDADPAAEPPLILQFTVDGHTSILVPSGRPVVLAWQVSGAVRVQLFAEPGGLLLGSAQPTGTFRTEPLEAETRFVLTASGPAGEATKIVRVRVEPSEEARIGFFRAVPDSVLPGVSSSLSWEVFHTEQLRIDALGGETILAGDTRSSGTVNVAPAVTTTYLLTASGRSGLALASATVLVVGSPRVLSFRAEPSRIARGASTLLVYRVENADRVVILRGSGEILTSGSEPDGEVEVAPLETERYTLSVSKAGFPEVRAELTVLVDQPPGARWVSAGATPEAVDYGDPVEVTFEADNAPEGMRALYGGREVFRSELALGSFSFTPTTSESLELHALNMREGDARIELAIEVRSVRPRILGLAAHPSLAILGAGYTVGYEVRGAEHLELHEGSIVHPLAPAGPNSIHLIASSTRTVLRLEATNPIGTSSKGLELLATDQPVIDGFSLTPEVFDGRSITATLSYAVRNATSIELSGPGGTWARFPSPFLAVGRWSVLVMDSGYLRLRADNGDGTRRLSRSISRLIPEAEPNDVVALAQPLAGDGGGVRGTLETTGDVDVYEIFVEAGSGLTALLGRRSLGCPDPAQIGLVLLAADGISALETAIEDGEEACLSIRPLGAPGATVPETGPVYLEVRGSAPIQYVLTASVSTSP